MNVISVKRLREFWTKHRDARSSLSAWYHEARDSTWASIAEVRRRYPSASTPNAERVVFNIWGNKYRLVVRVNYRSRTVFVRFVGTHAEYDAIDAETV